MTREPLLLFAAALAVRVAFIHLHPIVFGGDSILRLANSEHILLSYNLPVLQAAIWALGGHVLAVRYLMALSGAASAAGAYLVASHFFDRRAALAAGLMMATSPFLVELSLVPYQEIPMLAALLFAFHFYYSGRHAGASLALGLACLTRYEAWCAVPVLIFAERRRIGRALLLFGWAPALWIIFRGGLSPAGTFVLEWPASLWRLQRYAYLAWITLKNTPPPIIILVLCGAGLLARSRPPGRLLLPAAFVSIFLISILFSAHGVAPDPERYVASREAVIPIAAAIFVAAATVARWPRWAMPLCTIGLVWGIIDSHRFLLRDTGLPHVRLSYRLAQYLDKTLAPGEKAAILARAAPAEGYLKKIERRSGAEGVRRAREMMAAMDTSPPEYQRTLIHSKLGPKLGKERLLSRAHPSASIVAVWSDYAGPAPEGVEMTVLREGAVSVRVIRAGGGRGPP
ncbi:MAG: glycosyltransferase family 39 protein [Bryobacteraceae bacterium]